MTPMFEWFDLSTGKMIKFKIMRIIRELYGTVDPFGVVVLCYDFQTGRQWAKRSNIHVLNPKISILPKSPNC